MILKLTFHQRFILQTKIRAKQGLPDELLPLTQVAAKLNFKPEEMELLAVVLPDGRVRFKDSVLLNDQSTVDVELESLEAKALTNHLKTDGTMTVSDVEALLPIMRELKVL